MLLYSFWIKARLLASIAIGEAGSDSSSHSASMWGGNWIDPMALLNVDVNGAKSRGATSK